MKRLCHQRPATSKRLGLTTPVIVLTLLIAMMGLALVLDRIWLETAQLELTTAAEITALAAARQLADDDRLIPNLPEQQRLDSATTVAQKTAMMNRVAGELPSFSPQNKDILFGNYSQASPGQPVLFETHASNARSVRITLHRTRARNNPVALFISQLTHIPYGNVVRAADATVNNHIEGIRPVHEAYAPMIPLSIWKNDPTGRRTDTWDVQIEKRQGSDNYRFDSQSHAPVPGQDGIPEMTVFSSPRGVPAEICNMQVVDLGSQFEDNLLRRQFQTGISEIDLNAWGGVLNPHNGLSLPGTATLLTHERESLEQIVGEPRICLLHSLALPEGTSGQVLVNCVKLVAVRVMSVQDNADGSCVMILQPTVITTRSALVTTAVGQPPKAEANKYIYNLQLTN